MKRMILVTMACVLMLCGCAGNIKEGVALLEAQKYEEAKECFEKDIKKGANLDEAYEGKGIACFELKEYKEAAECFEKAIEQETKNQAVVNGFLGACYIEEEEYLKALDAYVAALADEEITEELKQEIEFNRIAIYEKMGNWDAAKKQMKQYIKNYPDDTRVKKDADFLETR